MEAIPLSSVRRQQFPFDIAQPSKLHHVMSTELSITERRLLAPD